MPDIHIIPNGERWNVKVENGDVVSTHDTQAQAESEGKAWARERGGGEGARVEVLHEGPIAGDPIAVRVDNNTIALRRREAMSIFVA